MEFKKNRPIYCQVADHIAAQILHQQLQPGARIPGIRQLAGEMKVTTNTVGRSYRELCSRAILKKTGTGHFVTTDARALVVAWWTKRLVEKELPVFFQTMRLLNIGWKEIENRYERFKKDVTLTD